MKEDSGHLKKGDVLKAAGYNKPALNSARGNVLTGNYAIQWTGPLYLKQEDTMDKVKDYMATFFGVVFIMSMVGATGAVEADNYLIGFVMALVGISTGILTLILQNE